MSIREITPSAQTRTSSTYSARKLGFARGGSMAMNDRAYYEKMKDFIPLFEGFLTYGGMSVREMEAMTVGLEETMDESVISQGPQFIEFMVAELQKLQCHVVTPAGGLGCHINARKFLSHVDDHAYPAAALAAAVYIASGVRGMGAARSPSSASRTARSPSRKHGAASGAPAARIHHESGALCG
ncbi:MAG: hypothetical protein R2912_04580 [Eubacteriales bacterium]